MTENRNLPSLAPHIPAEVYGAMERGGISVPSAILPAHSAPAPAGVVRVWTKDGREILIDPREMAAEISAPAASAALPRWVLATAILMPTAAGSVALGAWGISMAAAAFAAIASALWAAFWFVVVVGVLVGVIVLTRGGSGGGASATATATATTRGLFGKSSATATATVRRR